MKKLALVVALLALTACGPDAGEVVDKEHRPAYTSMVCTGKPVHCTPQRHAEKWRLKVKADGETGWVEVSRHEYEKYPVGRWYP